MKSHRHGQRHFDILAAQRRRRVALWLEQWERLLNTPVRTADECITKEQALELMQKARPD